VFKPNYITQSHSEKVFSKFLGLQPHDKLDAKTKAKIMDVLNSKEFYKKSPYKFENEIPAYESKKINISEEIRSIEDDIAIVKQNFSEDKLSEFEAFEKLKQLIIKKHLVTNCELSIARLHRVRNQVRKILANAKGYKKCHLSYDLSYYGTSFKGSSELLPKNNFSKEEKEISPFSNSFSSVNIGDFTEKENVHNKYEKK